VRIPSHLRSGETSFNMTPMIDVVFLLIIFFLVSSHLVKQENRMNLNLSRARAGREAVDDKSPRIVINVRADGTTWITGSQIASQDIAPRLRREKKRLGDAMKVRIRGDRAVPYRFIEPILVQCTKAGIWDFNVAVVRKGGKAR